MSRILVTGAAGLLGQHLVIQLQQTDEVLAIDRALNPFAGQKTLQYIQADLLENSSADKLIIAFQPEIIFNCAAYTDVDGCENNKVLADQLNVDLVEHLLRMPFAKFVHFSTDYVFDGRDGPYGEADPTNPISYYGQTKLRSENSLKKSGKPYLIIRSNVLFGHANNTRPNFITWLIDTFRRGQAFKLVTDQFNNPISALNLAKAAVEAAAGNNLGILHIGGADYFSRFDMGKIVARRFKFNARLIEPVTTYQLHQAAPRPLRGGLKIDKAKRILKTPLLGFEQGLECMADY
jgi:dTDP-4-dehydrorhamnose reductase